MFLEVFGKETALFAWLISHQPAVLFLSEQTSHQQPASSTFLSEQTSTSHQPPANRTGCRFTIFAVHLLKTTKNQTKSKYLHSHYAQLQKVVSILISLEVRVKM
jgi:hypothetical protein